MSDARLSCISCGQSIDNLTSLSLRLARTSLSLSLSRSERHKVSDAFACCPVWPLTYSLYDKSKSSSEKERKLEKIFSLCKFNGRMSQNFMSARGFFPFAHILFLFSFPKLFLSLCRSSSSTLCVIDRKL